MAVTLEITNDSTEEISLDTVTVDLVDAQGRSASPISDPNHAPLGGPLSPGDSTSGTYVFTIPVADRDEATLHVTYAAPPTPTVIFEGSLPDA